MNSTYLGDVSADSVGMPQRHLVHELYSVLSLLPIVGAHLRAVELDLVHRRLVGARHAARPTLALRRRRRVGRRRVVATADARPTIACRRRFGRRLTDTLRSNVLVRTISPDCRHVLFLRNYIFCACACLTNRQTWIDTHLLADVIQLVLYVAIQRGRQVLLETAFEILVRHQELHDLTSAVPVDE